MTQQEQFEADYRTACPKHGEPTLSKYKAGKHLGKYVNQVTRTAFRIWLQQAKRHEAEIAELVEALKLSRNGVAHPHYVDAVIAQYEVKK